MFCSTFCTLKGRKTTQKSAPFGRGLFFSTRTCPLRMRKNEKNAYSLNIFLEHKFFVLLFIAHTPIVAPSQALHPIVMLSVAETSRPLVMLSVAETSIWDSSIPLRYSQNDSARARAFRHVERSRNAPPCHVERSRNIPPPCHVERSRNIYLRFFDSATLLSE